MRKKILNVPFYEEEVRALHVGEVVYLTGRIFAFRDMGHFVLKQRHERGETLPVDLSGAVVFHASPVVIEKQGGGFDLVVIGPTTSIRMESYHKMVARIGVRGIIGKGGLGADSLMQFAESGQVYFQAPPGCAVALAEGIKKIEEAFFLEHGFLEALWVLRANELGPLVVAMDSHGKSIYAEIKKSAEARNRVLYG